jgi:drug/metabolite transporter (DMT)-like permease
MSERNRALVRAMPWVFVLIWSTGFIVAKYAMPHSPPMGFLSYRFAFSVLCFGVWIAWAGVAWPRGRMQWFHLAVTGLLMQAGYLGGVWAAVKAGIGAGTVALLVGLQPVLTAIWITQSSSVDRHGVRLHHKISTRQWSGLLLGLAGIALVVWRKLGAGELTALNLGLAIVALLSMTIGTLYQKRHVAPCDVRTASTVQMAAGLAITLPLAFFETEPFTWHPQLIGAMAWSVLALSLGASSLLYLMIQRGEATAVTSVLYLVPPCTALLAWLLFGESFTPVMWVGMLLTVAGVALVVRPVKPEAAAIA